MKMEKRSNLRHILAAILFCLVLSISIDCYAEGKGTVLFDSKIRQSPGTDSEPVGSAKKGKSVDIVSQTTGADGKIWYEVYVEADKKGYIRSDLVKVTEGNISTSNAGTSSTTTDNNATAPSTSGNKCKVTTATARIRKSASTSDDSVGTVNKGAVLNVTGETTGADGKVWYQIENNGVTGYIRSDLVSFDNVGGDPAVSQISGEGNGETQVPEGEGDQPTEEQPEDVQPPEEEQPEQPVQTAIPVPIPTEEKPYVMPGFKLKQWNDREGSYYQDGNFYIYYGQETTGEQGWYLVDIEKQNYIRYAYTVEGVSAPSLILQYLPVIALAIVIVILIAIIGLMFLKLREYGSGYSGDDDEEESEDDDIEDLENMEDDLEEKQPRRPVSRPASPYDGRGGQPMRRSQPQGGMPQGEQPPVRRPQPPGGMPQGANGQPVRRPQPQGGMPQGANGQPVRRPQSDGEVTVRRRLDGEGRPMREPVRPQGSRPAGGQPQRRMNPNPQQRPPQAAQQQRGYRENPMSEEDAGNLEYIDIE